MDQHIDLDRILKQMADWRGNLREELNSVILQEIVKSQSSQLPPHLVYTYLILELKNYYDEYRRLYETLKITPQGSITLGSLNRSTQEFMEEGRGIQVIKVEYEKQLIQEAIQLAYPGARLLDKGKQNESNDDKNPEKPKPAGPGQSETDNKNL